MLEPGTHTITLIATNSSGASSTKDFRIEIVEDESDLPNDWSRNDITLALRLGVYLPLHRLESPVTRVEFARTMFMTYILAYPVTPVQFPDDMDFPEFRDMSNDENNMDYIASAVMVGLGLMDAPDGKFNPNGSLTEREAMQIMYMTIEVARNRSIATYGEMAESSFIPELMEWGILGTDGPNAYRGDEKLSIKLALARIGSFIRYEYDLEEGDYGVATGYFDMDDVEDEVARVRR